MTRTLLATFAAASLALAPAAAIAQIEPIVDFEIADSDDSGEVSLVELQAVLDEGDDESDVTQLDFDAFDQDGSGGLNAEEFEVAMTSLGVESGSASAS